MVTSGEWLPSGQKQSIDVHENQCTHNLPVKNEAQRLQMPMNICYSVVDSADISKNGAR